MTTILVVEDEAVVAIDMAQRLKRGGYDVPAVAATGEAALRMTEELRPDLVLMDILLKGEKDGIETAREIEDQFEIPIIFLTGQTDESTLMRIRSTSHYGFLLKPIDAASLFPTVEMALARHAFSMRLKESENRFRAVTDSAADAIFSMDIQGNVTYWNKAAERTFGWKADDITGQSVTAILPESAKAGFFKMLPTLGTRETYVPRSVMLWRRKDGTEFPAEPSFASWKTKEGKFATAIVRDISEQKAILESVQAGIVLIDPITHKIVDVNTTAARLFGAPKDAITGSVCHRFICPAEAGNCPITDLGKTVDNAERVLLTADGKSRPILKSVSKITLRGCAYLLESFIDIGERKQMELALRESETHYRTIFESTPTGMALVEEDMTVAMMNSRLEELSGFSKNEVEGLKPWTEFVVPEDLEVMKTYHRARRRDEGSAPTKYEFRLLTKDGTYRQVLVAIALLPGTQKSVISFVDVTARKEAEEALIESERHLRELTNALPELIFETDVNGVLTFVSGAMHTRYGWTIKDIEGKINLLDFVAPFDRERARETIIKVIKGEHTGWTEYSLFYVDGSTAPFDISTTPIFRDGVYEGIRGIAIDITERKRAEEALRKQAAMLDAAHDAVMTLDPEGIIAYWNRGAERLYGYTKQEAEGQDANTLLKTKFRESKEVLWSKLKERGLWEGELTHVTRDGVPVTVASSWTLLRDEKGNVSAILEISSDITERKKAELALAESEAKLSITFATMADGIVIVGLDEKVTDCNEAILRLTQRSMEEIIGKPSADLFAPEFRSQIPDARKHLVGAILTRTVHSLREKGAIRTDSQLLRKNGKSVDIEANISVIEDTAGQPAALLVVARDVTERKKMEQQLDNTLADLQRSNAELEQFAYIASHDLQEPLRMITSYIQIIEEDYKGKLDADADQYIAFIVDGAKRMQTLTNDLLAYSRVGTRGEPFMPTSTSSVLSEAITNLEVAIEKSHAVVTHDQLPTVFGDGSQLIQLFQNLLGNAIKFRSDETPIIHVGVEETKDDWVFSVRDNGIGIDMKYAERIFTVFRRLHTREDYPGTGIGLAIVKKIVEHHGGRVWVESALAKGSTFYFTLPKRGDMIL
jgi:PAS domain S-box-containing protein